MQNEVFETVTKLTQTTLENWKKLGEANLKLSERLLQQQIEFTTAFVESTTATAEELSQTRDAKDVAAIQAEWAQNWSKQVAESSRSCADILAEAGKTYNNLFESAVKSANAEAGKAASKAKKAA